MLGHADEEYLLNSAPTVPYTGSAMDALRKATGAVSGIVAHKVYLRHDPCPLQLFAVLRAMLTAKHVRLTSKCSSAASGPSML